MEAGDAPYDVLGPQIIPHFGELERALNEYNDWELQIHGSSRLH